jgi:hypothetical protein
MPYSIRKVRNKSCYKVTSTRSGRVHSKCTSLDKAKRQVRLLHGVESGWVPSGRKRSGRKRSRSKRSRSKRSRSKRSRR